ncbi:MAG: sigma-54 dependent transcriptional regulator [Thermodesulfovibrionia bacterium]
MAQILVVDDERDIRRALEYVLSGEGHEVDTASNGIEAINKLKERDYDLIITDLRMEGVDGFGVLKRSKEINASIPVIIITAYGTIDSAVEAMKLGASDYIVKPFLHDDIKLTVTRILEQNKLSLENIRLKRQLSQQFGCKEIIGSSEAILRVFDTIEKVAPTKANVLITGESGTGKGLIAETIHHNSPRADKPFMSINCAAIPETLLESELFGYKKGAFTGATSDKVGLMVMANEGTLFLDEIGDMPLIIQSKLLNVLESGEVLPLGDTRTKRVDVRIISATNKDIETCIKQKTFREDLYYRLNVIEIRVPPLRERREDIPLLANHFLKEGGVLRGRDIKRFDEPAMKALISYSWPGNVRELRNVIERAIILSDGERITINDLPQKIREGEWMGRCQEVDLQPLKAMVSEYEKEIITNALKRFNGNKEMVVRTLGIDLATLYRKMHKYGIKE